MKKWPSRCNNTTKATLCATSEVRAERVRRHAGVLAQPRSHSLGGEEDYIRSNYDTICTVCLMYYVRNRSEVSGAEVRRSEGSKRSESGVRDSEVRSAVVRRFEYRFQPSRNRYVTSGQATSTSRDKFEPIDVEVILDNTLLYNNITEIITREYAIMNEIQSY